ncbi:RICIN domain-containing protein [Streptomyces sp. I05A-00742]|uniref:RICIN domain-containing protein n=1 Tax=Streptomyces sp. I05A-00742 TaxID=2732853 RepID=UPI0014886D9F|nr:RICIN domain-containing protein [Streptomyces sp. I05A-00742]
MKKLPKLLALATAPVALAAVLAAPGTGQAATPSGGTARGIVNQKSEKCLEIENSSRANGARAQQWDCGRQMGALWRIIQRGSAYQLKNEASDKCLEVENSSKKNGARVQQWDCNADSDTQLWEQIITGRGVMWINRNSKMALEVSNGSHANGARVQQWDLSWHALQQIWNG